MNIYDRLRSVFAAQNRPLTRVEHAALATAGDRDQISDGLAHVATDIRTLKNDVERERRRPSNLALESRARADGSTVQLRPVYTDHEPREPLPPDPQVVARRQTLQSAHAAQESAKRDAEAHQRAADWRQYRAEAQRRQAEARRKVLLGDIDSAIVLPFLDYALPLSPPSWFGRRDGHQTFIRPIVDEPERNPDGSVTIRARGDVSPLSGRPYATAAPAKTPAQVFGDAP